MRMYDVVAKRFRPWGYAYPFIETALGLAFLFRFQMTATTWIALVLSLVGAIGVIQANLVEANHSVCLPWHGVQIADVSCHGY